MNEEVFGECVFSMDIVLGCLIFKDADIHLFSSIKFPPNAVDPSAISLPFCPPPSSSPPPSSLLPAASAVRPLPPST